MIIYRIDFGTRQKCKTASNLVHPFNRIIFNDGQTHRLNCNVNMMPPQLCRVVKSVADTQTETHIQIKFVVTSLPDILRLKSVGLYTCKYASLHV